MKILVYQWKAYNGRDIEEGFKALGHEVFVFSEQESNATEDPQFISKFRFYLRHLHQQLGKKPLDFVFSVDFFLGLSEACEQDGIRYVSWSCDAGLSSMYYPAAKNKCNYFFLFDKADYLEFKGKLENVYYLPLAASLDRISAALGEEDFGTPPERFENEVSFVGTLYAKNQYDALYESFDEYLRGYLDACLEAQLNISGGNILELLLTPEVLSHIVSRYEMKPSESQENFQQESIVPETLQSERFLPEHLAEDQASLGRFFVRNVLGYKAAREERLRILRALGRCFPTTLYGSEAPPDYILRSARYLKIEPTVDYWTELPILYYRSKINLNLTIPNIASGVPLRVFDILMSGGFLLTNDRPELHELFYPEKELVIFDGIPDLISKIRYYLIHKEEREMIAKAGQKKVLEQYDLKIRLQEIIQIMSNEA
ncbi:MAG: glycosyltransferase [Lachnospiraceae bacterium]|nr:glycosyltransferase [Lachnospiraceae bacterium]